MKWKTRLLEPKRELSKRTIRSKPERRENRKVKIKTEKIVNLKIQAK